MVAEAGSADPLGCLQAQTAGNKLTAAGLDMTPEVFTAYTILKPCLILLGIIPCLLILPILTPLVVVLALLTYFKESRRADELCKARMELVEGELPRFVATIHQELAASRDVLRILENYKKARRARLCP
jgi:Flp pilus assembly protein TadB